MSPLSITLLALVAILFVPFLISVGLVTSVNAMSDPDLRLRPADERRERELFAAAAEHHSWAKENGFEWEGAYMLSTPQPMFIAAWRHRDAARWFCIYTHANNNYFDFATSFDHERGLTTAGTKDAHTLPFPPGKWVQSEHGADPEQLWELHQDAEAYLAREHGLRPENGTYDFPKLVVESIRKQMEYVKSFPLWPVRGVVWYLVRGSKSGRTVAQQDDGRSDRL